MFSWISSSLVFSNRSVKPIIPFKGVLISWLILAKNDLALLAASAYSRLLWHLQLFSSVISSIIPSIYEILPLLITASPNSTQTTVPLLFMIRYVK
jgi:hypothetical protein